MGPGDEGGDRALTEPIVDAHCHLWIEPPGDGEAPRLADESLAERELRAFSAAGGSAVIDCQPGGCGRDGRVLARLAAATRVRIAPATGFHLARYYAPGASPYEEPAEVLMARWRGELERGLAEEPSLRARVVKSAWSGEDGGRETEMILAAAEAAASASAALVIHTERGTRAEALPALLSVSRLAPGRVQISHVDKRADAGLHRELASAGFTLGYDAFLRPKYEPDETTWRLLERLAGEGLWERITVGLDLVETRAWSVAGGKGLPAIPRTILPRLTELAGEREARAICGANAARLLGGIGVPA